MKERINEQIEKVQKRLEQLAVLENDMLGALNYKDQGMIEQLNVRNILTKTINELQESYMGLNEVKALVGEIEEEDSESETDLVPGPHFD